MITIGKLDFPETSDLFEDEETNNRLCAELKTIYNNLEAYIKNAETRFEQDGIGFYEYCGARGYDSHDYLEYDDEEVFKVEGTHPQLPDLWKDADTLTTTIRVCDHELEVTFKPVIENNQYLFVLER
jgi:hypothetical protein